MTAPIHQTISRFPLDNYPLDRDVLDYYSYKIISHKKKFIYCEYPKTASNSIKSVLFPELYREYCGFLPYSIYKSKYHIKKFMGRKTSYWPFGGSGDLVWRKIFPQAHFVGDITDSKYSGYFKFSAVRNPFDKMVSAYTHGAWGVVDQQSTTFEEFVSSLLPGGKLELKDLTDRGKNHFMPWTSMFGIEQLDFVIRLENIAEDMNMVLKKIGIRADLPKANVSRKNNEYQSYYNDKTKQIVADLFAKDLQVFGYTF